MEARNHNPVGAEEYLAATDLWFAWRPVRLTNGRLAWWQIVNRRRCMSVRTGHGGQFAEWTEYSAL